MEDERIDRNEESEEEDESAENLSSGLSTDEIIAMYENVEISFNESDIISVENILKITERNTSPTAFNSHLLFIHSCPLVHLCTLTLLLTLFFPWPS